MNKIGVIMGSDSDLPVMSGACEVLVQFGVGYEVTIVSAHRTPEKMVRYAKTARDRGLKLIIAGAGGAAHLPGMTAALTTLPVIGVPVMTKTMSGLDSLYSIVQMPFGIPVATVAINGAKNAGLLAVQMLGAFDEELYKRVAAYKREMEQTVQEKAEKLEALGYEQYLNGRDA